MLRPDAQLSGAQADLEGGHIQAIRHTIARSLTRLARGYAAIALAWPYLSYVARLATALGYVLLCQGYRSLFSCPFDAHSFEP